MRGEVTSAGEGPSVHVAEVADWLVLHDAQVVHRAAEGHLDSLADAGRSSFHHFDLVDGLVQAQRHHLGSRKPLPGGREGGAAVREAGALPPSRCSHPRDFRIATLAGRLECVLKASNRSTGTLISPLAYLKILCVMLEEI